MSSGLKAHFLLKKLDLLPFPCAFRKEFIFPLLFVELLSEPERIDRQMASYEVPK
jgi:hypothetical protein